MATPRSGVPTCPPVGEGVTTGSPPSGGWSGSYAARTDHAILTPPSPPPTLGVAPYSFTDPTFGSQMIRVSDALTAGGTSLHAASNAHIATWNSDGTRFYAMKATGGAQFFKFNRSTHAVTIDATDTASYLEPSFSYLNPTKVYCGGYDNHCTIYSVDLTTGTKTILVDLYVKYPWMTSILAPPSQYPSAPGTVQPTGNIYTNALTTSSTDSWAVAFGGTGSDSHTHVHWQKTDGTSKLLNVYGGQLSGGTHPMPGGAGFNCLIHSVAMSQDGRYVFIYTTSGDINATPSRPKVIIWDTTLDACDALYTIASTDPTFPGAPHAIDHCDGHDCQGYGLSINQDTSSGTYDGLQWTKRSIATPHSCSNVLPATLTPQEVYIEDHSNWRNNSGGNAEPYFSFTWRHDSNTDAWRAWDNEILAILTDGSTVWRFCHTQSNNTDQFWNQPIGHVNFDGSWALFTSNWMGTMGMDTGQGIARQDVFLVHLQ